MYKQSSRNLQREAYLDRKQPRLVRKYKKNRIPKNTTWPRSPKVWNQESK
jgi:hypothetical protein